MHRPLLPSLILTAVLVVPTACKTRAGGSDLKDTWFSLLDTRWKPVQEVADRNEYLLRYEALPASAEVERLPWSLPAQKLAPIDPNQAAATVLFAEPQNLKGNPQRPVYSSAAIKSLLVSFIANRSRADDGVETVSLGGICRLDGDTYRESLASGGDGAKDLGDADQNQCFAVNAGAFHLALANFIGLRRQAFLIDPEIDAISSHHPLTAYRFEPLGVPVAADDGHTQLPTKTTVKYLLSNGELRTKIYRYTLEVDEAGDVVDGQWMDDAKPQLIWMQNRPRFREQDKTLEDLYAESASLPLRVATPDFPSLDLEDPNILVLNQEPLRPNHKYRIELTGDVPRGADGLKTFLDAAFRRLGPISIYRNTFADEDRSVSIEIQMHGPQSIEGLKKAIREHSNERAEIERILR